MKNIGQGIVEGVVAIGILGLVLTGVVVLIVMTLGNKKTEFDRKKAVELGAMVMEEMVSQKNNDGASFWRLDNNTYVNQVRDGYAGYTYSIGFTNIFDDADYPNCGVGATDCAEVVVRIGWTGKSPQTFYFNRFFSKE